MKKFALILALLSLAYAFPAPVYYTFTGTIAFIPVDQGGYAASHGIKVGGPVTYIFVVDTALNGFTKYAGTPVNKNDVNTGESGYTSNYFFDSLITPSLFSAAVSDTGTGAYYGYHTITSSGGVTRYSTALQTMIGNPDRETQIIIGVPDTGAANWLPKLGKSVSATESYIDSSAAASSASVTLVLTSISDTRPSNGIRLPGTAASSWMSAELQAGALVIQNHSGKKASARIMDAAGKTMVALSIGEKAVVPAAALPAGRLFLEVTSSGQVEPALQSFWH